MKDTVWIMTSSVEIKRNVDPFAKMLSLEAVILILSDNLALYSNLLFPDLSPANIVVIFNKTL